MTRFHFETITYADICPQGCRGEAEPVFSPAFQVSARLTPPPPKRHGRGHGGELLDVETRIYDVIHAGGDRSQESELDVVVATTLITSTSSSVAPIA